MRPRSTYRLQLNHRFGFEHARALVPYLARLGITHLYCSPILTARPGSLHGYDTCDHARINPELGGEDGFRKLAEELRQRGMGVIVDFVPNHMCADAKHNAWWRDVLANGPSSAYSRYFDIDWDPVKPELKQKVLLPILGAPYGEVLESGQLRVEFAGGRFGLHYWEHELPLNPRQVRLILRHRLEELRAAAGEDSPVLAEYLSILFQLDNLPPYTVTDLEERQERQREVEIARRRLQELAQASEAVARHVQRNVEEFNGSPGEAASFDLLHELLEAQAYRLAYWRTALHEINYRRFFDINELAALRMEDDEVFEETHRLLLALVAEGLVDGIRLDHVDGLYDPALYCQRLRESTGPEFYIVVEKILSGNEPLDSQLGVDGTTGYGFLNTLSRLFVAPENEEVMRRIFERATGLTRRFAEVVEQCKKLIIGTSMASELNVLAHELNRMSEGNRRDRDFTLLSLQEALRETVAAFSVYRTYLSPRHGPSDADRQAVAEAVERAVRSNPALESSIFAFIQRHLLPEPQPGEDPDWFARRLRFAMKVQQYTGPVQAKGVEDTAFYRHGPLMSLNEVGGEPDGWEGAVERFHASNLRRQEQLPYAMITTATHDTKRGEDARMRIHVLSEVPDHWRARLQQWSKANAAWKKLVHGRPAPDRADEYIYYQSLLGAWPLRAPDANFAGRMRTYMAKAVKEAKVHTSWVNPSNEYDSAISEFVHATLLGPGSAVFLRSFAPFASLVAFFGAINSLTQLTLKLASPGVPDFYQGGELWDLSLVDPDNRQPVDFETRTRMVTGCGAPVQDSWQHWNTGEIKLRLTSAGLQARRAFPKLFVEGSYEALVAEGPAAEHVVAFSRRFQGQWLVAMGLRKGARLVGFRAEPPHWAERLTGTSIRLPEGAPARFQDLFTGQVLEGANSRFEPSQALATLPCALLLSEDMSG